MDRLRALRYFLEVANTSSFTAAARTLCVPASSISRRVRDLEESLGVELLHRSTRVVQLTELGLLYRSFVHEAVESLELADALVSDRSDIPSGTLVITCTPSYGQVHLIPVLERFVERYPQIVLDLSLTDEVVDLGRGEVDLAIRATGSLPERCVARRLTPQQFQLVGAPEYLERRGHPRVLADLAQHDTLLFRGPHGVVGWHARQGDGWRDVVAPRRLVTNDGALLLRATCCGRGLALLPHWGIGEELARGRIAHLKLADASLSLSRQPGLGVFLLYFRPRYQLKKIRVAVEFLIAELTEPGLEEELDDGRG